MTGVKHRVVVAETGAHDASLTISGAQEFWLSALSGYGLFLSDLGFVGIDNSVGSEVKSKIYSLTCFEATYSSSLKYSTQV